MERRYLCNNLYKTIKSPLVITKDSDLYIHFLNSLITTTTTKRVFIIVLITDYGMHRISRIGIFKN